ncbi:MAG: hypothetical protein IT564_11405 [Rhodospirillales bacterium]|nr:hypothetical protein [Rhodospirillales bacterium]
MGSLKATNEYSNVFQSFYEKTPKSVFAAIAVSLMSTGGELLRDDPEKALANIIEEWETLHTCGIIPQKPPSIEKAIEEFQESQKRSASLRAIRSQSHED